VAWVVGHGRLNHCQVSDLGALARGRGWRFAQLSIRHFLELVYRLVALSPVMAAPEVSAGFGSAHWSSLQHERQNLFLPDEIITARVGELADMCGAAGVNRAVDD
jgi:hypothetical protein